MNTIGAQGRDCHLISGLETPLRVLTSNLVGSLGKEALAMIAAEDSSSLRRRYELKREIGRLSKGKKYNCIEVTSSPFY